MHAAAPAAERGADQSLRSAAARGSAEVGTDGTGATQTDERKMLRLTGASLRERSTVPRPRTPNAVPASTTPAAEHSASSLESSGVETSLPPSPHSASPATTEGRETGSSGVCSPPPRPPTWLDEFAAVVTMLLIFASSYFILPVIAPLTLLRMAWRGSRVAMALLALWATDAALPPRDDDLRTRRIAPLRWLLFRSWRRYFEFEIISEVPLDPSATYVYGSHPHGVFPIGQWLSVPYSCDPEADPTDAAVLAALPTRMRGAVASVLLHVPLLRHLMAWAGMAPAAKDTVRRLLGRGISVVLIPGGIAEIFHSSPDREVVLLRRRLGFVRAAVAAGVPLVPIYCFGNTAAFHCARLPESLAALSRALRVSLVCFWGRGGLPLPFRTKLLVAVGPPLAPRPGESAEELHSRYCEALTQLFDRNKARMGPQLAAKQLHVV